MEADVFWVEVTVQVEFGTAVLDQSLKRLLQNRNHLEELKDARQLEKQLLARINELEKQNKQNGMSEKQKTAMKKEFNKSSQGLTAVEWFDKAMVLCDGKRYVDSHKALENVNQASRLDPSDALVCNNRGITLIIPGEGVKACRDLTTACSLGNCGAYEFARQKGICK